MKKVLFDTNIVLDLLAMREPYYKSAATLFTIAENREINAYISALTVPNIAYIMRKSLSSVEIRNILKKLLSIVRVLRLDQKIIENALNDSLFSDFEDALQYHSALANKFDFIITRNIKDFKNTEIPAVTAESFIALYLSK